MIILTTTLPYMVGFANDLQSVCVYKNAYCERTRLLLFHFGVCLTVLLCEISPNFVSVDTPKGFVYGLNSDAFCANISYFNKISHTYLSSRTNVHLHCQPMTFSGPLTTISTHFKCTW